MSASAGKNPIEFHLALLPPGKVIADPDPHMKDFAFKSDRMRRVIETVRDKSGWGKKKGLGFAAWWSFVSYTAQVAEVPGAISQGRTRDEARANVIDALAVVLTPDDELAGEPPDDESESLTLTVAS